MKCLCIQYYVFGIQFEDFWGSGLLNFNLILYYITFITEVWYEGSCHLFIYGIYITIYLSMFTCFVFLKSKDIFNNRNGLIRLLSVLSVHLQVTYKVLFEIESIHKIWIPLYVYKIASKLLKFIMYDKGTSIICLQIPSEFIFWYLMLW